MSALSTLRTYVKRDFKRTDKDTEVDQAINDMIMWIATKMPHGNYKYQSWINTAVGREDYSLPTNLIHLMHPIRLIIGTNSSESGFPLSRLSKEEYDIREPNPNRTSPSTGRPSAYTIFSRSILVTPIPDLATYLLEINWSLRPVTLTADADLPSLGSEWDEVIKHGAMERVYAGMGMMEDANYWGSMYRDLAGNAIGLCATLLDAERDREMPAVGQVKFNEL
jgi:hypothetical protein